MNPSVLAALKRFRLFAVLVGIGLLILVFVAVPLRYLAGYPHFSEYFSPVHGLLYMIYVGTTFDLGRRTQWPLSRTVGVMLAGTVPFLSFYVERRVAQTTVAELEGVA